jgi:hypothetical protein
MVRRLLLLHDFDQSRIILEGDKVSLHGGPNALDTVIFDKIDAKDSLLFGPRELEALKTSDLSNTILTATMADGNNGFPGTLRIEVLFVTIEPSQPPVAPVQAELGAILIVYRARLTEPGKITPVNLTHVRKHYCRGAQLTTLCSIGASTSKHRFVLLEISIFEITY